MSAPKVSNETPNERPHITSFADGKFGIVGEAGSIADAQPMVDGSRVLTHAQVIAIDDAKQGKGWQQKFPRLSELETGAQKMIIERFLPEGPSFLGSLSGVGKTWVALSMVKSLRTGEPFLKLFKPTEIAPVVYLVPEMGGRSIRSRSEKMRIPDSEELRFWTMKQGRLKLNDPYLLAMVKDLKPVVFLDTAIRFLDGEDDENSSSSNNVGLFNLVRDLLNAGARAVVCLHHSPKTSKAASVMTLENVLRGTGDLGAMSEVVWGIERERKRKGNKWDHDYAKESDTLTRLRLECVKGRDMEDVAGSLVIQGRPYITDEGDFRVLSHDDVKIMQAENGNKSALLIAAVEGNNQISKRELSRMSGFSTADLTKRLDTAGWEYKDTGWGRIDRVKNAKARTKALSGIAGID